MASCHTILLPRRVDLQSADTADLAVSQRYFVGLRQCDTSKAYVCIEALLTDRLTYGKTLETNTFQFSSPDYVYMLMFGMGCMSVRILSACKSSSPSSPSNFLDSS